MDVTTPLSSTLCNAAPLTYAPKLLVTRGDLIVSNETNYFEDYKLDIFINGNFHSNQTIDPWSDMTVTTMYDYAFVEPFEVNQNDDITFVIDFEGDNFPDDDTLRVTIPSSVSTPTSISTSLAIECSSSLLYDIYDSDNNIVNDAFSMPSYGSSQFSLQQGSCYSISFLNSNYYSGLLKDAASNTVLHSVQADQYSGDQTPRLYFNVVTIPTPADISEETNWTNQQLTERYFLDALGKRQAAQDISDLAIGIYFEISRYSNGTFSTKKLFKNK
jgi:hypothetical protein